MSRIVMKTRVGTDGSLHLNLPLGLAQADTEVQVTVEPLVDSKRPLRASDLLQSGLVGIWADRTDIGDSREFARRLREQAQTQKSD